MPPQSHLPYYRMLPPGEFNVMIPELRVTLQGAVTWRNQCHDRATLQGVIISIRLSCKAQCTADNWTQLNWIVVLFCSVQFSFPLCIEVEPATSCDRRPATAIAGSWQSRTGDKPATAVASRRGFRPNPNTVSTAQGNTECWERKWCSCCQFLWHGYVFQFVCLFTQIWVSFSLSVCVFTQTWVCFLRWLADSQVCPDCEEPATTADFVAGRRRFTEQFSSVQFIELKRRNRNTVFVHCIIFVISIPWHGSWDDSWGTDVRLSIDVSKTSASYTSDTAGRLYHTWTAPKT